MRRARGLALFLGFGLTFAALGPAMADADEGASVMILLDASKSMGVAVSGTTKMAVARSVLGDMARQQAGKIQLGLTAFGTRQSRCGDIQTLAPVGEIDPKKFSSTLAGINARGVSPLSTALQAAARAGGAKDRPLDIILLTDSLDSCRSFPCTTAAELKKTSQDLRIHVIAFDGKARQQLPSLSCIAEKSGGQFAYAATQRELAGAIDRVMAVIASPGGAAAVAAGDQGEPAAAAGETAPADQTPPAEAATPDEPEAQPEQQQAAAPAEEEDAGPPPPLPTRNPIIGRTVANAEAAPQPAETAAAPAPEGGDEQAAQPMDGPTAGIEPAPAPAEAPAAAETAAAPEPAAPGGQVPVTFIAMLTETGPKLQTGVVWRVFDPTPNPEGGFRLISTSREAQPVSDLAPGDYLVNAAYGLSNLTKKIKVSPGRTNEETFVLNTGGLRLGAVLSDGTALAAGAVRYEIFDDEADQLGNRQRILADAQPGMIIRLNAGGYHIVSSYGDANAVVRADVTVEPGKLTEATVNHSAAKVTFKLVAEPGGEAIPDTQWVLQTLTGDLIKESAGALPTHILAPGSYSIVARYNGGSYAREFKVESGRAQQIEVVVR